MIESAYAFMIIGGPIILLIGIVWGLRRNQNAKNQSEAIAEEGAKQVREEIKDDPQYE